MASNQNMHDPATMMESFAISAALKKSSRIAKKDNPVSCFSITADKADIFFQKLSKNINDFQKPQRFQLAVCFPNVPHWLTIDCFIDENGVLNTFTLDSIAHPMCLDQLSETFKKYFPNDNHYFFENKVINNRQRQIQYSRDFHCIAYAREFSARLSRMDSQQLYSALRESTTPSNSVNGLRSFNMSCLNNENTPLKILAPIFRGMQSYTNLNYTKALNNEVVSKKRNKTLAEWMNSKKNNKDHNVFMDDQLDKYFSEVEDFRKNPNNKQQIEIIKRNRSGFGYITFPVMQQVVSGLQNQSLDKISEIIESLAEDLKKNAPRYRDNSMFAHFKTEALHYKRTMETVSYLNDLVNKTRDNNSDKNNIIHAFNDIVLGFAGYLNHHESVRTMALLESHCKKINIVLNNIKITI